MPQARDSDVLHATPAAFYTMPLIGTRATFAVSLAVPSASKTCVPLKDAISQPAHDAGLKSLLAPLKHRNAIIAAITKEACHPAEGSRIAHPSA